MLCICFSANSQPFAMLLPLSAIVVVFCCIFLNAFFNSASIAPLADTLRRLLRRQPNPVYYSRCIALQQAHSVVGVVAGVSFEKLSLPSKYMKKISFL